MLTTKNMMLAYRCENGEDYSGNTHHVTLNSHVSEIDAVSGKGWKFPGVNGQRLRVPYDPSLNASTGLTFSAWIRRTGDHTFWSFILAKRITNSAPDDYSFEFGANERLYMWAYKAGLWRGAFGTTALPLNTWTHRILSYDSGSVTAYLNGIQEPLTYTAGQLPSPLTASNIDLYIGERSNGGQSCKAELDEIQLYQKPITPADAKRLYLGLHPLGM